MVWDVSPVLLDLGVREIRWYGLFFAAGFLIAIEITQRMYRWEGLDPKEVSKIFLYTFVATLVGARLGHCLFYEPAYYLQNPLEILFIWKGGLASHGGTAAVIYGLFLYAKKNGFPFLFVMDRVAVPTAFVSFCIRMGNLFNSEIVGHPTDVPWAFVFTRIDYLSRHPSQLYEALSYLTLFFILLFLYLKTDLRKKTGALVGLFLIGIFGSRFIIEMTKENQVAFEEGMFLNMGQLLSIPFVIAGAALFVRALKKSQPS